MIHNLADLAISMEIILLPAKRHCYSYTEMLDPGAVILSRFLMISRPLFLGDIHFLVMGSQFGAHVAQALVRRRG